MTEYVILWIKACGCAIDAHLLQYQGQRMMMENSLNQKRSYERQMATLRLNKVYGGLR